MNHLPVFGHEGILRLAAEHIEIADHLVVGFCLNAQSIKDLVIARVFFQDGYDSFTLLDIEQVFRVDVSEHFMTF